MLALLRMEAEQTTRKQHQVLLIAVVLTALATILGLVFSTLVSAGVTRPVHQLLEGTRAVEAGRLDATVAVTSQDEIGHLTAAFNRMIEQLRLKERIRETFGKYIDPRIVEGLIDRPALAAEGQRRVMTVLFCDVKGFSGTSEGMTPQGLVKVMNRYFSTMSAPIRRHQGVIDKYIGDAIMAYWGPPFTDDAEQARLACLAALDMLTLIPQLRAELPELLGVRTLPNNFDIRIGIATGEVLVGSIGSELMMSYTVMGDTVNFGIAPGGRQQGVWRPCSCIGSHGRRCCGRRRGARDRSHRNAGPIAGPSRVRDRGQKGRVDAHPDRASGSLFGGSRGLPRAAVGSIASGLRGGAESCTRRWTVDDLPAAPVPLRGKPSRQRLGRLMAARAKVTRSFPACSPGRFSINSSHDSSASTDLEPV